MPCIGPDGTLTKSAEVIINALGVPLRPDELSKETGIALYLVRSALRELVEAGLVRQEGDMYKRTGQTTV
jgi:hypothetical protein